LEENNNGTVRKGQGMGKGGDGQQGGRENFPKKEVEGKITFWKPFQKTLGKVLQFFTLGKFRGLPLFNLEFPRVFSPRLGVSFLPFGEDGAFLPIGESGFPPGLPWEGVYGALPGL